MEWKAVELSIEAYCAVTVPTVNYGPELAASMKSRLDQIRLRVVERKLFLSRCRYFT